jgi:antitoxin Phd
MATWKLEDAKNQFSRLVRAAKVRPQVVTRHGREEVVVVSVERYRELAREGPGLVEFVRGSPLAKAFAGGDLVLTRTRELPREIEL